MSLRALIEELVAAWRTNDAYRASAFFTLDATYSEPGREPLKGREAILEHFRRFFRDGPPWRFDVDEIVAEGNRAAVAYRFAVKTSGDDWDERAGCALVRCEGGLIEHWREYYG